MITAVDSSIILDVLLRDPVHHDDSVNAIQRAHREGRLVVSEFVIAEIHPVVGGSIESFLSDWELEFIPCSREAAIRAGALFSSWLRSGRKRGRIVADFLIAAHSHHHADRLLSRDTGFSRKHFQGIRVVQPKDLR